MIRSSSATHRPLKSWRDPDEIRDRIAVLRAKGSRIVVYNETLDPTVLDEKQLLILEKYRCRPGVDRIPAVVFSSLRRTIDYLETLLRGVELDRADRRLAA